MSEDFLAALVFGLFCLAVTLYALREWGKLQDERIRLMRQIWELEAKLAGEQG